MSQGNSNKTPRAVLDASALYSARARDLLLRFASKRLYQAKWTDQIDVEWVTALIKNRPGLDEKRIFRTRDLMRSAILDWEVRDYFNLVDEINIPDSGDRHVVAAAIKCEAKSIVTFNLRDFPESSLKPYGIIAIHPGTFIANFGVRHSLAFRQSIEELVGDLKNPPMNLEEYCSALHGANLDAVSSAIKDIFIR